MELVKRQQGWYDQEFDFLLYMDRFRVWIGKFKAIYIDWLDYISAIGLDFIEEITFWYFLGFNV